MSAKDIAGSVNLEDHDDLYGRFDFAGGDNKKLLNYKYKNAKDKGLLDDILKNGIDTPIEIHVGRRRSRKTVLVLGKANYENS